MLKLTPAREAAAERTVQHFVLHDVGLGIYDPLQPRRPKVEVASFAIEIFEVDEEDGIVHAAGPVVLKAPSGDIEQFLRVTVPLVFEGEECRIPEGAHIRAVYIIDTDHPNGGCKETAALANL